METEENEKITLILPNNKEKIKSLEIPKIWTIIHQNRKSIIIFWLCLIFPLGKYYHPKFIASTDSTLKPIPGSQSYEANSIYQKNYLPPHTQHINQPILIYLQSNVSIVDDSSFLYKETEEFVRGYTNYLISLYDPGYIIINDWYTVSNEYNLKILANKTFIRNNGQDMILQVSTTLPHSELTDFITNLQSYGNEHVPRSIKISYTGMSIFQLDMIHATKQDTRVMDVIALPAALVVLCIVLQCNIPLLLIPIIMIGVTMNAWSIVMYPISQYMQVTQVTPSIMSSLSIAMGIDYSLFILSRIQEETTQVDVAILTSLTHAGYSILISGCTIMTCLFGLALLPLESFVSLGLGSGIAILCCLLVNLTLVPAILFTRFGKRLVRKDELREPLLDQSNNGVWFRFGNKYIHHPKTMFMFITMIILPFAIYVPSLQTSISNELLLPSNSPALEAYNELSKSFGAGYLNPYRILFDGSKANKTITSSEGFDAMHKVYNQLNTNDSYSGISILAHHLIEYDVYIQAIKCGIYCSNEILASIAYINSINTANPYVSYLTVVLENDPYSVHGTQWLTSARDITVQGYDVYIQGGAAVVYDAMTYTIDSFPTMILVTSIIVLILMAISFKSIITPIRSLLSIAYTLLFSYGLFVLVYQYGIFNWTNIRSISSYTKGEMHGQISFVPPIMAFTVIVGLSLDYDVFLLTRIYEYRIEEKYKHKSSILLGLQGTGRIITAAGIIMFIAFGGLLASSCLLLNQYAFLLMSSVLLDTFVVRTVLVPCLLSFSGRWSWWPNSDVVDGDFSVLDGE